MNIVKIYRCIKEKQNTQNHLLKTQFEKNKPSLSFVVFLILQYLN